MTTSDCHGRAKCDQTYLGIRQLMLAERARAETALSGRGMMKSWKNWVPTRGPYDDIREVRVRGSHTPASLEDTGAGESLQRVLKLAVETAFILTGENRA